MDRNKILKNFGHRHGLWMVFGIVVLLVQLMSSCYKDVGNYDYQSINEIYGRETERTRRVEE